MTYQLATAKVWNGSAWANVAGGANVFEATNGTTSVPYTMNSALVAASATANTKGAYVTLWGSTTTAIHRLFISLPATFTSAANSSTLLDIAVGAAGSEVVVIPDVAIGFGLSAVVLDFPIYVPSGSRISARTQSSQASKALTIGVGFGVSSKTMTVVPSTSLTSWGAQPANSRGLGFAPSATINTDGPWYELTADCGAARKWILFGIQANGQATLQASNALIDVAIGAAGSEVVILSDIRVSTNTSEQVTWTSYLRSYFVDIPANSRIAVRMQNNITGGIPLDITATACAEVGSV